ncbi:MAG TPA: hypothetical protein VNE39_02670 [Planctomycetota bacterium]|nr:hypothetical protein [Planctomycetota bacterium]
MRSARAQEGAFVAGRRRAQPHDGGGEGIHVAAVNQAVARDVPGRVERAAGIEALRQEEGVENVHPSIAVNV